MRQFTQYLGFSALSLLLITACQQEQAEIVPHTPVLPAQLANYASPQLSASFWVDQTKYLVTDAGATVGRVLFYDNILSKNNTVSCGSCHLQEKAFADPVALSTGINGQILTRNTPAITNIYDDPFLFWDGRAKSVTDLVLKPVRNHKEMGLDNMDFLVQKVQKASYYAPLFEQAYGKDAINAENIADALSQFLCSMLSGSSKYDAVMAGEMSFTPTEQQGRDLFFGEGRCYQCHSGLDFNLRGGTFIDFNPNLPFGGWGDPSANIGLDMEYADQGMGEFTQSREGEFKIPSLRNVALTAPYMHDGRFATLNDVVDHYSDHIAHHENLAPELLDWNTGDAMRLNLSNEKKNALVSFLGTLTDTRLIEDEKFSDPFKR